MPYSQTPLLQEPPSNPGRFKALINEFVDYYNHHRPHRSLPHAATPAARYNTLPKATPDTNQPDNPHHRIRHDIIDTNGKLTLRIASKLHHIGIGRTHARTPVIMLINDLHVRVINAETGEILRDLHINTDKDYQPQNKNG